MEWLIPIRWLVGGAAILLGTLVAMRNWITLIRLCITKESTSFVPLVGGFLGALGLLIVPLPGRSGWIWLPLVGDWGCLPMWTWIGVTALCANSAAAPVGKSGAAQRVVWVDEFGALGDGRTDDGPAIQRALREACSSTGPAILRFRSGKTYRILSPRAGTGETAALPDRGVISLEGISDLTVDGNGARLLLHPDVQFFYASDCRNLTLRGFEVDMSPQPFVPGRVLHVDPAQHTLDVRILPGFDLPGAGGETQPRHPPFFGWILPVTERGNPGHYFIERLTEAETGSLRRRVIRLHARSESFARFEGDGIVPGSRISVPVPGAAHVDRRFVQVYGCRDVTVADLSVWSLPYFAFNFADNSGTIRVRNVTLAPQPGTERLTSSGRDGFHCKGNRGQMIFENCTLAGLRDDAFNISSMTAQLQRRVSATEAIVRRTWWPTLGHARFAEGDLVVFWDGKSRTVLHADRVSTVEPFEEATEGGGDQTAKLTRLIFGRPLPGLASDTLVSNLDISSPGAIIRGCRIEGSCRMRAPVLIEDSTFTGFNWFYGDRIEGPFPRQVMIRNSHFINGDFRNNRGDALLFASPVFAAGARASEYAADDIVLENNVFDGAVLFRNCRNLAAVGNRFNRTERFQALGLENALFRGNVFGGRAMTSLPGGEAASGTGVRVFGTMPGQGEVNWMKPFTFFTGRLAGDLRNRHVAAVKHGARARYAGRVTRFGATVECYLLTPPGSAPEGGEIGLEEDLGPEIRRLTFKAAPREAGGAPVPYAVYACDAGTGERVPLASGELAPDRWTEVAVDLAGVGTDTHGRRRINITFLVRPGKPARPVLLGSLSAHLEPGDRRGNSAERGFPPLPGTGPFSPTRGGSVRPARPGTPGFRN